MCDAVAPKKRGETIGAYQSKLRSLASQLITVEERERHRIASYLHDEIGQTLSLCKIKLGELQDKHSPQDIRTVRELIGETLHNIQLLTVELNPPVLHGLSFEDALQWLCERMHERYRIPIVFEHNNTVWSIEEDVRVTIFHAVRELLTNVGKHAHATLALVQLRKQDSSIVVTIYDNGTGFSPSHPSPSSGRGSFGLFSIRERLSHLGGTLMIESSSGKGSTITVTAPAK